MNWIQKHALTILLRSPEASLKQMRPEGVDSNLFSYHIHYLKTNGIIESVTRGQYHLTTKGMHVAGTFNASTGSEAQDVKSVIVLYARRGDDVLLFKWSRHPYFGYYTLPHDRYNYGISLDDALAEAVQDKLQLTVEQAAPTYQKSGMIHIFHDGQQISCMSAHVYKVSPDAITERQTRNGDIHWIPVASVESTDTVMRGVSALIEQLETKEVSIFEATLTY